VFYLQLNRGFFLVKTQLSYVVIFIYADDMFRPLHWTSSGQKIYGTHCIVSSIIYCILWPEDGPVQRPKHVVSLNKYKNIRQSCFDSKEPLFNYLYQRLLLSTHYFIWVQFNNPASIRCPSNYRKLLYSLPYFCGKLDSKSKPY